jgi:hypothetical protein
VLSHFQILMKGLQKKFHNIELFLFTLEIILKPTKDALEALASTFSSFPVFFSEFQLFPSEYAAYESY